METLYEATKTMVSSYDINTVLDIIVRESARIMKAKGAALHLVKEGREELTSPVSFGLSETFFRKGPVKRSEGLFPQNPDDVIMVEDVKTDPRIVYPKEAADEAISSIISIPLVHKGEVTGDLRLYSENPRQYSRDEISFLKVLAGGAAVVIEDVRTWKRLKERNQKTIFYANKMSHDLRAPVYAVQSLLSAMEKGYAGEITSRQKEILNRCINKQGQLLQLIKDILILAEEQAPVHEQKPVSTCLDAVAGDTLNLLNVLFQQKQIAVEYTPPPEPISFREIPGDFQRLFSNLLENALRYTPEGGRVEVAVKRIAENISIIVKDTGIGIESEHIEKIFDEFYRTARAKKIVQDGTGLGLPTVKTIVERYNGFINVESRPDKGTTFFITLPDG
jgi:signal transduction histidine kinase